MIPDGPLAVKLLTLDTLARAPILVRSGRRRVCGRRPSFSQVSSHVSQVPDGAAHPPVVHNHAPSPPGKSLHWPSRNRPSKGMHG